MKKPRFWPVDCLAFRQLQALVLRVRWPRKERIAQQTAGLSALQRAPRLALMALLFIPLLSACDQIEKSRQIGKALEQAFSDIGTTALVWEEEVPLHDGNIIVIKRREVKSGGGFPVNSMNPRGITRSYEFCYPPMGLYWKSKGGPRYQPEILEIVDGKAYVKVPISGPETCMFHDYPTTNAIYFVWENAAWKKIPYEAFPQEIRRTNLLQNPWGIKPKDDMRGLVTVFQKEQRDGIYGAMKRTKGRIQSLTDYPSMHDACERQRGGVRTTNTPEVFLTPTPNFCPQHNQGGNTP